MTGSASDAHVAPGPLFHFFVQVSEVKGPAVSAGARMEDAIEQTSGIAQRNYTAPITVADSAQTPGAASRKIIAIQVFKRRIERTSSLELETRGARDVGRQCIGRAKRIDVSTVVLVGETKKAVGKRGRVGHRDKKTSIGTNDTADLAQRCRKPPNVLQAVICDDSVKATIGKGKASRVRLDKTRARSWSRQFKVHAHHHSARAVIGREAAGEGANVKYARAGWQVAQDLNHGREDSGWAGILSFHSTVGD